MKYHYRIGYALFLLSCLPIALWIFHETKLIGIRASLPQRKSYPYVDDETWRLLGSMNQDRTSSFIHHRQPKPAGRIRIGAIGDSHTFGTEVDDGYDYPALLQAEFLRRGYENVEVLNFGNGWFGFYQAYLLWDRVGRYFDLDYALLGPGLFHSERDLTFNHSGGASPHYVHARYVLESEGKVRLVAPVGGSQKEISEAYHALLPAWTYLRYDVFIPRFYSTFLGLSSELRNPFYHYKGDPSYELGQVYSVLLNRMAASTPAVVLNHRWKGVVNLARNAIPDSQSEHFEELRRFPYFGDTHAGPLGNDLAAKSFFALLTGQKIFTHEILDVVGPAVAETGGPETNPLSIDELSSVTLDIRGASVGRLASVQRGYVNTPKNKSLIADLAQSGFKSILGLKAKGIPLSEIHYFPVRAPLRAGAQIWLHVRKTDGEKIEINLGPVQTPAPGMPFAYIESRALSYANRGPFSSRRDFSLLAALGRPLNVETAQVFVDGSELTTWHLKAKKPVRSLVLDHLFSKETLYLAPDPGHSIDVKALPQTGTVDLHLITRNGLSLSAPYLTWQKGIYRQRFTSPPSATHLTKTAKEQPRG